MSTFTGTYAGGPGCWFAVVKRDGVEVWRSGSGLPSRDLESTYHVAASPLARRIAEFCNDPERMSILLNWAAKSGSGATYHRYRFCADVARSLIAATKAGAA